MDGSIFHYKLTKPYQKLLDQIEEQRFSAKEIASNLGKNIIKDFQAPSVIPVIDLIPKIGKEIGEYAASPLFRDPDKFDALKQSLERQIQQINGNQRAIAIAKIAVERFINELQYCNNSTNFCQKLFKQFVLDTYTAEFEAKAKSTSKTCPEIFAEQLRQIRPHIEQITDHLAKQFERTGSVKGLRLPKSPKADRRPVELDENIG
jgi:hypothetical protein